MRRGHHWHRRHRRIRHQQRLNQAWRQVSPTGPGRLVSMEAFVQAMVALATQVSLEMAEAVERVSRDWAGKD